jgi:hypothetical protein
MVDQQSAVFYTRIAAQSDRIGKEGRASKYPTASKPSAGTSLTVFDTKPLNRVRFQILGQGASCVQV